ncbi:hypothetical protein EHM76_03395 [bacterium]|nr:MAG: hypothetical protein EHM76_03395 [bacterium]
MSLIINNRIALGNIRDLSTPTSTQQYKLGSIVEVEDTTTNAVKRYMYVKSHTGLTAYQPYLITNLASSASQWITAAPATLASAVNLIGVPQVAFTSGYFGFVLISGRCSVLVDRAVTSGWTLECLNAGTSLAGIATTELIGTIGIAISSTTGAGAATAFLSGRRAEIRATS